MSQPAHPLRSVHTSNLPEILKQLHCSLVVTTYQAGRVILVRYEEPATGTTQAGLNTHFRPFDRPMGVCADQQRLSIGGANTVWDYHNVAGAAAKLEPAGKHDGCFVPRDVHFTGDIDIHEMNWASDNQLWLVNTRFSCLCTLDGSHSFYPRWRPWFVSALAPEDRCHLNGLAMRDGKPRYVTALGETDTAGGWRINKANGGLLIDIERNEILLRGLSMPHSPRWYRDQLWVLESGRGTLSVMDARSGELHTVAKMPGFTRGIDFIGPLAFIGLSKIREKAVFSGIPIATELTERVCGVWVVNIETGQILGFLRFESGVEEIFAVQLLRGIRYPEMLMPDDPMVKTTYVLPDDALADVVLPSEQQVAASPQGMMARGFELFHKRDFVGAAQAFQACLETQPDFPNAHYSLGVALAEQGESLAALPHLEAARDKEPDRSELHVSLGSVYQRLGRFDDARAAFEAAIVRQPDNAAAHESLGILLLQLGDYARGLDEYQWRLKTGQSFVLRSPHPVWDGAAVPNKTLLVYLEHEDARRVALLARLLARAAERCRKLIVLAPDAYASLLATVAGVADVRRPGDIAVTEFDTQVSLDSLPHVLGVNTQSLPGNLPYFDTSLLRKRLSSYTPLVAQSGKRLGLVVCNDNESRSALRANQLDGDTIAAIVDNCRNNDITLYALTDKTLRETTMKIVNGAINDDHCIDVNDLAELALTIEQLDALIGVDSAALHLAGAMGKRAMVLLGVVHDWCWPAQEEVSRWYPTVRAQQTPAGGATSEFLFAVQSALR